MGVSGVGVSGVGVSLDGLSFGAPDAEGRARPGHAVGRYHQDGDLVWAEFSGGPVRHGSLAGTLRPDGVLEAAYCQVMTDGAVVSGRTTSHLERLDDGRIRVREQWRRFGEHEATGVSYIEELREAVGD